MTVATRLTNGTNLAEQVLEITIPTDNDGFILMECPLCGELFKLRPEDIEDDSVLDIRCPQCGIVSDSYLTKEVIELAMAKAMNVFFDDFYKEIKKLERKTKNKNIQIKTGKKSRYEHEPTLMPTIEALSKTVCENCQRPIKLTPALLFTAYSCPYCGVSNFNER